MRIILFLLLLLHHTFKRMPHPHVLSLSYTRVTS